MQKTECGSRFLFGTEQCVRPPGHWGLHRNTRTMRAPDVVTWGDNEQKTENPDE